MKAFLDRDFLLDTGTAALLYHGYAEEEPILDFHNHLSPRDIAEHRRFRNLTELWLEGDHYKWRAMRAQGVSERMITGDASPREKFDAWARVVSRLPGSPLYHWLHLELQRYFGITEALSPATAERIWKTASEMMEGEGFDAVSLLEKQKVRLLCTTDDPADDLFWHRKIAEDRTIPFRVLPSFRPDRYLGQDGNADRLLLEKTGETDILTALSRALDRFEACGARVADQAFSAFALRNDSEKKRRMEHLAGEYARRGFVMTLHIGALRNNSPRLFALLGPDAGGDSIGGPTDPAELSDFLGGLEEKGRLPKTILFNLNPADNRVFASMAGNFAPAVQLGAAWWFNDHLRGNEEILEELAETGALSSSVGMLTDSRSFTSFVRHEYFRRILCRYLGRLAESGAYPADTETLGAIVKDVCFENARHFFGF